VVGVDIEVVTSLEPELQQVRIDRGQLVQCILNLAVNARDAMPGGGKLMLASRNTGDVVVLEVSDNGEGMPAEVAARACEPFFTTKELGKGTGMGLAVVHGIVIQAGGRLEIESKPGIGTTVRIYFPGHETVSQVPRVTSDADERGVETILIVDDDDYVRRATARALRNRGYTVMEASSGRAALSALPSAKIDLMLTDIMMPGMNGRVLAEHARARFPDLRILFMTGYTDDETLRVGVAAGEFDLIEKPFTIPALTAKVREVLDCDVPMRATSRRIALAVSR
jgi:CheY-like chemotaxis protein